MAEQLISASGTQYGLIINPDGSINTVGGAGGGGSQVYIIDVSPISSDKNNPAWSFTYQASGTATGMTGSSIGSIFQYIGATTYSQKLTWQSGLIVAVGSWS